jgi:hypothetical protein
MSTNEIERYWKALDGKHYATKEAALKANAVFKDVGAGLRRAAAKGHHVRADDDATHAAKARARLRKAVADTPDAQADGVSTTVTVNGVDIKLDDVSPGLRRQYHDASKKTARHAGAKDDLQAIGEQMLAEVFPKMAMKYATLKPIRGHDAVAHLMGLKKS